MMHRIIRFVTIVFITSSNPLFCAHFDLYRPAVNRQAFEHISGLLQRTNQETPPCNDNLLCTCSTAICTINQNPRNSDVPKQFLEYNLAPAIKRLSLQEAESFFSATINYNIHGLDFLGLYYRNNHDFDKAIAAWSQSGTPLGLRLLGDLHRRLKNISQANWYYLAAARKGDDASYEACATMHLEQTLELAQSKNSHSAKSWRLHCSELLKTYMNNTVDNYLCAIGTGRASAQYGLANWFHIINSLLGPDICDSHMQYSSCENNIGRSGVHICNQLKKIPTIFLTQNSSDNFYLDSRDYMDLQAKLETNAMGLLETTHRLYERIFLATDSSCWSNLSMASYLCPTINNDILASAEKFYNALAKDDKNHLPVISDLQFLFRGPGHALPSEILLRAIEFNNETLIKLLLPLIYNEHDLLAIPYHTILFFTKKPNFARLKAAACHGSPYARKLLTTICLHAPEYIEPGMSWMIPAVLDEKNQCAKNVQQAHFALLLCSPGQGHQAAFKLLCSFLNNNIRVNHFQKISNQINEFLVQCISQQDFYAALIFALRQEMLPCNAFNTPVAREAYKLLRSATQSNDAWTNYLIAQLKTHLEPQGPNPVEHILHYFNLTFCNEPYIVGQALSKLKSWSMLHNELAIKLLNVKQHYDFINPLAYLEVIMPYVNSAVISKDKVKDSFETCLDIFVTQTLSHKYHLGKIDAINIFLQAMKLAHQYEFYTKQEVLEAQRDFADHYVEQGFEHQAISLLSEAAACGDTESEKKLAYLLIASPFLIDSTMGWLKSYISKAMKDKPLHVETANFYIALTDSGNNTDDFKQAFAALLSLITSDDEAAYAVHNMPQSLKTKLIHFETTDNYAYAINALCAAIVERENNYDYTVFDKIHDTYNPCLYYFQCFLAEQHASPDSPAHFYVDGYSRLLNAGIKEIEEKAYKRLTCCIKNGNEKAHAILFCHALFSQEQDGITKAIQLFKQLKNKRLLFEHCEQHYLEALKSRAETCGLCSYILAHIYGKNAIQCQHEDIMRSCTIMQLALRLFKQAHKNGYACPHEITQSTVFLLAHYPDMPSHETDQLEQTLISNCSIDVVSKTLYSMLNQAKLTQKELYVIERLLQKLSKRDGTIAVQIALLYKDGKTFSSGLKINQDLAQAKKYAQISVNQKCSQAATLLAQLKSIAASKLPTTTATTASAIQLSTTKKETSGNVSVQKNGFDIIQAKKILENMNSTKKEVDKAIAYLTKLSQDQNEESKRFLGLYFKDDHQYKGYLQRRNGIKAYEYLHIFFVTHPEDTTVAVALISLVSMGQSSLNGMTELDALNLLQKLSSQESFNPSHKEISFFSILCYKLHRYDEAYNWLKKLKIWSIQDSWNAAAALLHDEQLNCQTIQLIYLYLQCSLAIDQDKFLIKPAHMIDVDFVIKTLFDLGTPQACGFLARIGCILGFNYASLKKLIPKPHAFIESFIGEPSQAGIILYMARHKLATISFENFHGSTASYGKHSLIHLNLLDGGLSNDRIFLEIIDQIEKVISDKIKDPQQKISKKDIASAYFLGVLLLQAQETEIRIMGMKVLFTVEQVLFTDQNRMQSNHAERERLIIKYDQKYLLKLKESALKENNWPAILAITNHMISRSEVFDFQYHIIPYLNKFDELITNNSGYSAFSKQYNIEHEVAFACSQIGINIAVEKRHEYNEKPYIKIAHELEPTDKNVRLAQAIATIEKSQDKAETYAAISLIKKLVVEKPSWDMPCIYLATHYLGLKNNPFLKQDMKKANEYLIMAKERGSYDADQLLEYQAKEANLKSNWQKRKALGFIDMTNCDASTTGQ